MFYRYLIILALLWGSFTTHAFGCEEQQEEQKPPRSLYHKANNFVPEIREDDNPDDQQNLQNVLMIQLLFHNYDLPVSRQKECLSLTRLCKKVNQEEMDQTLLLKIFFFTQAKDLFDLTWSYGFASQPFYLAVAKQDPKAMEPYYTSESTTKDSIAGGYGTKKETSVPKQNPDALNPFFWGLYEKSNETTNPKSIIKAKQYFVQSCEAAAATGQIPHAAFELGYLCEHGRAGILEPNLEDAQYYYQLMALCDPRAAFALSQIYANQSKPDKALEYALIAANLGHRQAQGYVGRFYHKAKKHADAQSWFDYAAQQGHVESELYLAKYKYCGLEGQQKDETRAFELFDKIATEHDHPKALHCKAGCYTFGKGIQQDPIQAKELAKQAYQKGHIKAGYLYGFNRNKDYDKISTLKEVNSKRRAARKKLISWPITQLCDIYMTRYKAGYKVWENSRWNPWLKPDQTNVLGIRELLLELPTTPAIRTLLDTMNSYQIK